MDRTNTPRRRSLHDRWRWARLTYITWLHSSLGHRFALRRAVGDFFST